MNETEFTVDLRTGKLSGSVHSGVTGTITWRRLFEEALRFSGEIHPDERAVVVTANERGLRFIVTENLCEDEGCPHHGTEHICVSK